MASARALAIFLGFCIACGEGYNILQSANRLIAASETVQAPKCEHAKAFAKAEADVRAAMVIWRDMPLRRSCPFVYAPHTSQRLTDALRAKELADKAVRRQVRQRRLMIALDGSPRLGNFLGRFRHGGLQEPSTVVAIPTIRPTNSAGCSATFVKRPEF